MRDRVLALLRQVAAGELDVSTALSQLSMAPAEELSFATVDHHRELRHGYPEVIFAEGKSVEHTLQIAERIASRSGGFLATRTSPEVRRALAERFSSASVNELGRTVHLAAPTPPPAGTGTILVVTAGTSDLPVAEEASATACALGNTVERLTDVGVAGIHRLLSRGQELTRASVVIVVAGMEGALPSVVGGLVAAPVIAVPTSAGYGASFGGVAALLSMLNSCAAGITVVNIDNGFGAGFAASRITHSHM